MSHKYKPGDVLVFGIIEDDFIGKAIAFLTDSDVSHSALVYGEDSLVEMTGHGIKKTNVSLHADRPIHHMRHTVMDDMTDDMKKVIKAADVYLEKQVPYDYPSLVILAGLLVYRKSGYTPKYHAIVDTILGIACWSLDKALNKLIHGENSGAMMCSQLVYQCFYDAGGRYRLKVENGIVFRGGAEAEGGLFRLSDLVDEYKGKLDTFQPLQDAPTGINEEKLAQELLEALADVANIANGRQLENNMLTEGELAGAVAKAHKFLDLLEKILEALGQRIPLPSLFVTPADLFENTVNLKEQF